MSSGLAPQCLAYKTDAAIAKGKVVKIGASSEENVQVCSAATDKSLGILQNATAAAGDVGEVALLGGAKGLAGGTIDAGDYLTSDGDGALVATTSANNKIIAKALEDAVAGDIFAVLMVHGNY